MFVQKCAFAKRYCKQRWGYAEKGKYEQQHTAGLPSCWRQQVCSLEDTLAKKALPGGDCAYLVFDIAHQGLHLQVYDEHSRPRAQRELGPAAPQ